MNPNRIVRTVNSNKPVNSKNVFLVDAKKPVCTVNSSKPVLPIDVRKSVSPVSSNKPVYSVDVCKSGGPVHVCKSVCLVDIRKPFFVDYWEHAFDCIVFRSFINTSVFNRTILYMILFINVHMTYLIFIKFFKCTFVILIGYFFIY